ncbi:class I SAM-dependent methyltransferase [Bellilinea sp.]
MKNKYLKAIIDWCNLLKIARIRRRSPQAYFNFEKYQGKLLVEYLRNKGVFINNTILLDVGSGLGGYDSSFSEEGAKVYTLDLDVPLVFIPSKCHVIGNALRLPYPNDCFDVVVCSSLIEHVQSPELLLQEILRVIKQDGFLYLSFPPFYSPIGGHHFSPFHWFGDKVAVRLFMMRKKRHLNAWLRQRGVIENPKSINDFFQTWGLYKLSISKVENILESLPIKIIDVSTRWMPINTTKIPFLREFITWHVQFLAKKR